MRGVWCVCTTVPYLYGTYMMMLFVVLLFEVVGRRTSKVEGGRGAAVCTSVHQSLSVRLDSY